MVMSVQRLAQLAQLAQTPEGRRMLATQLAAAGAGAPAGGVPGPGLAQLMAPTGQTAQALQQPAIPQRRPIPPISPPERKPATEADTPPAPRRKPVPTIPPPRRAPGRTQREETPAQRFLRALSAVEAPEAPQPAIISPVLPRGDRAIINPEIRNQILSLALTGPGQQPRIPSLGELIGG